jgi:hypothetical protein
MSSVRSLNDPVLIADCRRQIVRHIQCRSCGYEPSGNHAPAYCPKCRGGCWERFVQIGKLRAEQAPAPEAASAATSAD